MHSAIWSCSAIVVAAITGPVSAQTAEPSVDSYLCTFAGKCGTAEEAVVTRDAPATKGFRIARSGAAATSSTPTTVAVRDARLARVARLPAASPVPGPAGVRTRAYVSTPRANPALGQARPRADLMIAFELGSDRMTAAGIAKARIFAKSLLLVELSRKRFLIEGHTDSLGGTDSNRDLSRRRATAVADYLAAQGVGRDRLEIKGLGSDEPLNGRRASDPTNRRVEAELIS